MIDLRRASTVIFLLFALVVAVPNMLVGKPLYLALVLPFIASLLTRNVISKLLELFGIVAAAFFVFFTESQDLGITFLILASMFAFALLRSRTIAKIVIFSISTVIFITVMLNPEGSNYPPVMAFMRMCLFATGASAVYCCLYRVIDENRSNSEPLTERYMKVIERFEKLTAEALALLKEQGGKP